MSSGVQLFDVHCHLQDPRIHSIASHLIRNALHSGVLRFAVNGVSENDWRIVKEMAEQHPCVVPNFGLHPWYVAERTPNWYFSLREFFASTPSAAVGEIGLDKGSHGKTIDFGEQVEVFQRQLELAKELKRPVSVHCVRAFGDLLEILKRLGPFPEGLIMHSYLGSAEMVPELAKLGCYFSFSGHLSSTSLQKAKKMIRSVPLDRILLESDAPDALPKFKSNSVSLVQENSSALQELLGQSRNQGSESSGVQNQELNHPANIHSVLNYVSSLLEIPENELAEVSYRNAELLFSFPGSKVCAEG
ncbi:putative TatD family, metal-dependent hydrolase [Dioscorea sansibarensis]